jgi:hypothetical protein
MRYKPTPSHVPGLRIGRETTGPLRLRSRGTPGQAGQALHCATPDFLLRLVALASFMRLSLTESAHVDVGEGRVAGNPGFSPVPRLAGAVGMTILLQGKASKPDGWIYERPCHLAWEGLRPVSGGVFQVVKTAQSRERTGRTLLTARFLLSAGALAERRTGAERRDPSLSHYCSRSPSHQADKR